MATNQAGAADATVSNVFKAFDDQIRKCQEPVPKTARPPPQARPPKTGDKLALPQLKACFIEVLHINRETTIDKVVIRDLEDRCARVKAYIAAAGQVAGVSDYCRNFAQWLTKQVDESLKELAKRKAPAQAPGGQQPV